MKRELMWVLFTILVCLSLHIFMLHVLSVMNPSPASKIDEPTVMLPEDYYESSPSGWYRGTD